jgi:excisionase family DNA binding protein
MIEETEPTYLGVRQTAKALGVHENTVRNWAKEGLLPSARLPGARALRFDARDVERLRSRRGTLVASVEEERRVIPELVDATQLSQWAGTRRAQDMFPELMRRLLAASPGVTRVSVRSGDGVAAPGWDGQAESEGKAPFLPRGRLFFEFGVGQQPGRKADQDYEKRRTDPLGVVPSEAVFVFATPRRWADGAKWARVRRGEQVFADVHVLDADDLEGWLQETPAVHYWISEQLGRRPGDAETVRQWWARFSSQTDPALPAELFLAGREAQRERLLQLLAAPRRHGEQLPHLATVMAAWRDDAIAFTAAVIEDMERDLDLGPPPALIVRSAEVWDRVASQPGRMALVPIFSNCRVDLALRHGHKVVLPAGSEYAVRESGEIIRLPPPGRDTAAEALKAAGLDHSRAYRLSGLARRSMQALVRELARDPRISRPGWSEGYDAAVLAPLVLVNAWTTGNGDTRVVSETVGHPWQIIEQTLQRWATTDDPPFRATGDRWNVVSPEEAFRILRSALTSSALSRWYEAATRLLLKTHLSQTESEGASQLELPPEAAQLCSDVLRGGLAEGLALLGSAGQTPTPDGRTAQQYAEGAVKKVLAGAAQDRSGDGWWSIADVLPFLAEAAPEAFLDAIHDDLDRGQMLATMFQDGDDSLLYSSSPHTSLLWALEALCWSDQHLVDASRALARLAAIDPGGRLSNRPMASLETVLVGWARHTSAQLSVKIQAIDVIADQLPEVTWRLIPSLWSNDSVLTVPQEPRFRDWKPENPKVPIREYIKYVEHLATVAIDLAGRDADRWARLVQHLTPLPASDRTRVLEALERFTTSAPLDADHRLGLWQALHNEINRHRRFAEADWAMEEPILSRMETIAQRIDPKDDMRRYSHLFSWHVDLPEASTDYRTNEATLNELRDAAVRHTISQTSADGLRALALTVPEPQLLGWSIGKLAEDDLTPHLATWLNSNIENLRRVAAFWAEHKLRHYGIKWLQATLALPEMADDDRRRTLVAGAPETSAMWDTIEARYPDLVDAYWASFNPWRIEPADAHRAATELISRGRPWAAVEVLARALREDEKSGKWLNPDLVDRVLRAAADAGRQESATLDGYTIGRLLDYLSKQGVDRLSLADHEFAFFHLLERNRREFRYLYGKLGDEPDFFIQLVTLAFRAKNEPRRHRDDRSQELAQRAFSVLRKWPRLPGQGDDRSTDSDRLLRWVQDARLSLSEAGRADIGDEQIGQALAASPPGSDGVWPCEAVRQVIESIGSPNIETGLYLGIANKRGVTTRGLYEGGDREREIASDYRRWAAEAGKWPRTARLLRRVADSHEQEARWHDADARSQADVG